jgi:hypothetical protein
MDIGKEKEKITVEPLRNPVPGQEPAEPAGPEPKPAPKKVPAK